MARSGESIVSCLTQHARPRRLAPNRAFDPYRLSASPIATFSRNARLRGRAAYSCRGFLAHDDADHIRDVLGPELLHDAGTMNLDRARADPQLAARFLVGRPRHELRQHLGFARRQWLTA